MLHLRYELTVFYPFHFPVYKDKIVEGLSGPRATRRGYSKDHTVVEQ